MNIKLEHSKTLPNTPETPCATSPREDASGIRGYDVTDKGILLER